MLRQFVTLVSGGVAGKLTGVAREVLFAGHFGTSAVADAFRASLAATLSFAHLFTAEAVNAAFIPQFRRDCEAQHGAAWALFNGVGALLLIGSVLLAVTLQLAAAPAVTLLFPGFSAAQADLAAAMLRIMAWGTPFYVASALLVSLELGSGGSHLASVRPLLQNAGVIVAIVAGATTGRPLWVAWGFTGSSVLLAGYGAVRLVRRGVLIPGWHRHWEALGAAAARFWSAMRPLLLFSAVVHGNILLEKAIASWIGPGAVATVDYARLIPETAQALLITPLGLVSLAGLAAIPEREAHRHADRMLSVALLVVVPLSGWLLLAAPEIVRVLYGRGAFDDASVAATARALRGFAFGTWAVSLAAILQKIYNARLRNAQVLRVALVGLGTNALFNAVAYRFWGVFALGLGASLGGIVMTWLYLRGMPGLASTARTAKICFLALPPYVAVGYALAPERDGAWITLLGLTAWTALFWSALFVAFPALRAILQDVRLRVQSLRVQP